MESSEGSSSVYLRRRREGFQDAILHPPQDDEDEDGHDVRAGRPGTSLFTSFLTILTPFGVVQVIRKATKKSINERSALPDKAVAAVLTVFAAVVRLAWLNHPVGFQRGSH